VVATREGTDLMSARWAKRRRLSLAGVGFLLMASIALGWWGYVSHPPGVDYVQYAKIRHGMTLAEVEALMGERHTWEGLGEPDEPTYAWNLVGFSWHAFNGVEVSFDKEGHVIRKQFIPKEDSCAGWIYDWLRDHGFDIVAETAF
jgi:hypothetical protein